MSGAHCQHFPECMEFSEVPRAPKCSKPNCPGNRSWTDVLGKSVDAQQVGNPSALREIVEDTANKLIGIQG